MLLADLVPPPYARASACAGPCAWCGSDGTHALTSGAALARDVTLVAGDTLSHIGMWLPLSEGVRALRVYVSGSALAHGLIAPTAVRLHAADASVDHAPAWRGASLSGATLDGARSLVTELRAPVTAGEGLARVGVLDVAGLALAAGMGELSLRVVADAGGCLAQSVTVRVEPARTRERAVTGAYVAFVADAVEQAARVARWVDAVVASGAMRGVVTARASAGRGATIEGACVASARGVDGAAWREALRRMASGRASWVELWSPCDPERAGVSVALGTRARPAPCEMSAWADDDLRDAWWRASEHDRDGTLQALVGRFEDPVTPRVLTPWERARGLRHFTADAPWLGRFVRAPADRARVRGVVREGDAVRACWPGPVAIERLS